MKSLAQSIESLEGMRGEIITSAQETLIMMGISLSTTVFFGGMLGIMLFLTSDRQLFAHRGLYAVFGALTNFMRAFPFVILMIALGGISKWLIGTRIGPYAASFVLSVAGIFYFARLVEQNLKDIPRGIIEACTSMGASPLSIVGVLINEARSALVLSVTVLAIGLLSYSAAAGMIGGGGIGDLAIRYGYMRARSEVTVFVVLILSLVVIFIQALGNFFAKKLDKR